MKFNKEVFIRHYGKPYLDGIRITVTADVIAVILIILLALMDITVSETIVQIVVGLVAILVLSIFPVLPLLFWHYVKSLKEAKRQKQWFEDGMLHVLLVPAKNVFVVTTVEYIVHKVSNVHVGSSCIEIVGEITHIWKCNSVREERHRDFCRIPRNFSNEDELLKKLGVPESVVQIFCGRCCG